MEMVHTFVLISAVILNSIECSSQSTRNPHTECDSDSSSFSAGNKHSSEQTCTEEASARTRSRSPSNTRPTIQVLGIPLENPGYIRLISRKDESFKFEFRRCIFPESIPIRLRADQKRRVPVPTGEQIVISLSNGDVFAILESDGILRGIYGTETGYPRVKMNIVSGAIVKMTSDEQRACPLGKNSPIFPNSFFRASAHEDSLESVWNAHSKPDESPVQARSRSLHTMLPSDRVLAYPIEQIGYVRLIPRTNPNRRFEFKRYIFPANERIRMRIDQISYMFGLNQEYLVLSTADGFIFAIIDSCNTLFGIYSSILNHPRIKINMRSGEIINLTPDEVRDCPVGKKRPIFPDNFIEAFGNYDSLQSGRNPSNEQNPGSSSTRKHPPDATPPQKTVKRATPRSPPGRPPSLSVLGHPLAQLGFVRLIPLENQNQRFEFRRYFIHTDKSIRLLQQNSYMHVPNREHIVVSTSKGDVFAILEYTGFLRGMYAKNKGHPRLKINIMSGAVDNMTGNEMKECHVGKSYPIFPRWFHEEVSNEDSLQHVYH